jgi:hypothetical protein
MATTTSSAMVATPTLVYVALPRDEFDRLNLPIAHPDSDKVLVKVMNGHSGVQVIFQHWLG